MSLRTFVLSREPFRPAHMGLWIRMLYFKHYLRRFPPEHLESILDAGTGRGTYARFLAKKFPSTKITGIDILPVPEWSLPKPPNLVFEKADLTTLSENATRDLIVSVDVLEHIQGNSDAIKCFYTALRTGGILYLAVPCEPECMYLFPKAWFSKFHEWEKHEHVGEQRPLPELRTLLEETGFKILFSRNTFTFWGIAAWEMETLLGCSNTRIADVVRVLLMPIFKLLGFLDLYLPIGSGNNLIIAKKP